MEKRLITAWIGGYLKNSLGLTLILTLGFLLRVWGVGFGLIHADEPIVVNHALAYAAGDFHPHFFAIPPLVSYLLFFLYGAFFLIGKILGIFPGVEAFKILFIQKPVVFYVIGRLFFGVALGMVTIAFLYFFAKRIFSKTSAQFAALFLAMNFLHVRDSHYLYVDILMTLGILLTTYFCVKVYEQGLLKDFLWAGFWLGICVATKYNAAIAGATVVLAGVLSKKPSARNLIYSLMLSVVVYCFLNPFSILDISFFSKAFFKQASAESPIGFGHHFFYSLVGAEGWGALVLSFLGALILAKRDFRKSMVIFSFPVIFYLSLVLFSQHHERYVLPIVPFVCLTAGIACEELVLKSFGSVAKKIFVYSVISFSLAFSLLKSVEADRLFSAPDTTQAMTSWVQQHVPGGEKIALDHSFYRPSLKRSQKQWKEISLGKANVLLKNQLQQKYSDPNQPTYDLFFLSDTPQTFSSVQPLLPFDLSQMRKAGVHYVVIHYGVSLEHQQFYEELVSKAKLLQRISPYIEPNKNRSDDRFSLTCAAYSWRELFSRKAFGPVLEIYSL